MHCYCKILFFTRDVQHSVIRQHSSGMLTCQRKTSFISNTGRERERLQCNPLVLVDEITLDFSLAWQRLVHGG